MHQVLLLARVGVKFNALWEIWYLDQGTLQERQPAQQTDAADTDPPPGTATSTHQDMPVQAIFFTKNLVVVVQACFLPFNN